MKTLDYHTIDKSDWGPGPWQDEPDKRQWADEATGYPCLIVRAPLGHLCGYGGVPPGHPCYRRDYGDDHLGGADVHGGLTFAGPCMKGVPQDHAVCHCPDPGESDDVWWLGFDCAHGYDFSPGLQRMIQAAAPVGAADRDGGLGEGCGGDASAG